jgi:hypothetical protein
MTPIQNITFSFNEAEDRILLHCTLGDKSQTTLQLTRRLTGPLLEKLANLLLKTSDMAASLPVKLQEEVIMMEHTRALAHIAALAEPSGGRSAFESEEKPPARHLLTRIDFQPQPERCTLQFFCNGSEQALTAITFNRAQLHWFVDTLDRFALRADWEIRPYQRDWLALRDMDGTAGRSAASLH